MTVDDHFWSIIERTRIRTPWWKWPKPDPRADQGLQLERLKAELRTLSSVDLIAFKLWLEDQVRTAYRWDLWDAAYLLMQGCGDDSFEYFRCWLVAQGRGAFENAVRNPDTLADLPIRGDPMATCDFESFMYAPADVYQEKTGRDLYDDLPAREPLGEPQGTHEPDESKLPARFPRIARKWKRR